MNVERRPAERGEWRAREGHIVPYGVMQLVQTCATRRWSLLISVFAGHMTSQHGQLDPASHRKKTTAIQYRANAYYPNWSYRSFTQLPAPSYCAQEQTRSPLPVRQCHSIEGRIDKRANRSLYTSRPCLAGSPGRVVSPTWADARFHSRWPARWTGKNKDFIYIKPRGRPQIDGWREDHKPTP